MIIQEKDYIKQQKRQYLKRTVIWIALILGIYGTGIILTQSIKSYFTVFAGVLVIGAALHLTRWIGFSQFCDGKAEYAKVLEQIQGDFDLFHSAIIPDARGTIYFEHIVVTAKSVYMITYDEQMIKKNRLWLENKLKTKGIPIQATHVLAVKSLAEMQSLAARIQKETCFTKGKKNEYTTIMNEMLM